MAFDSHSNFIEIQKLRKELSAKSGNLVRYDISHVATEDSQTEFPIDLTSFDFLTDSVLVQSGRTLLSPTLDYSVLEHSVVLNEGVPVGRTVDIYVYKNVVNLDEEQTISGLQISVGTIPLDRLEEIPELPDVIPIENGGTGATTAEEALNNLGAKKATIQLDANVDLNTVLEEGEYSCPYYQTTIKNSPVNSAFKLEVHRIAENIFEQIYHEYKSDLTSTIYYRCGNSAGWSAWSRQFLPLTGGTLSGDLSIKNMLRFVLDGYTRGSVENWGNGETTMHATTDDGLDRYFSILDKNRSSTDDAISMVEKNDDKYVTYRLFGEHNIDLLRNTLFTASPTDIGAGSALATGKIHLVYE